MALALSCPPTGTPAETDPLNFPKEALLFYSKMTDYTFGEATPLVCSLDISDNKNRDIITTILEGISPMK